MAVLHLKKIHNLIILFTGYHEKNRNLSYCLPVITNETPFPADKTGDPVMMTRMSGLFVIWASGLVLAAAGLWVERLRYGIKIRQVPANAFQMRVL